MKKYLLVLVSACMFVSSFSNIGNCLTGKTKNSIYLELNIDGKVKKK